MITLIGGAGFLGSRVVHQLAFDGISYCVVDSFRRGRRDGLPKRAAVLERDIRDPGFRVPVGTTTVVILAALWLKQCESDPWDGITTNVHAIRRIWEGLPEGVKRIVYVSSASVYGEPTILPTPETAVLRSTTVYGWTKVYAEQMLHAYCRPIWYDDRRHAIPLVILRPFNLYGPGQDGYGAFTQVFPLWAEAIRRGQPVEIWGDGSQTMDLVYVDDAARAVVAACDREHPPGVYNVTSGKEVAVREVAETLCDVAGTPSAMIVDRPYPVGAIRQQRRWGDGRALTQATGWEPQMAMRDGLKRYWQWYCKRTERNICAESLRNDPTV